MRLLRSSNGGGNEEANNVEAMNQKTMNVRSVIAVA